MPQQAASHEEKIHPEQGKVSKEQPVPSPQHTPHPRRQGRMLWQHRGGSASHCRVLRGKPDPTAPSPRNTCGRAPLNRWRASQTLGLCDTGLVEVEQRVLEWLSRLKFIYQKECRRRAQEGGGGGGDHAFSEQQGHSPCLADGTVVIAPIWHQLAQPSPGSCSCACQWSKSQERGSGEEGGVPWAPCTWDMLQILQELGAKSWCISVLCTDQVCQHIAVPLSSGVWRMEMGKGSRREERKVKQEKKRKEKKKEREGERKKERGKGKEGK